MDGGVCTRAFDDTASDTDVNEERDQCHLSTPNSPWVSLDPVRLEWGAYSARVGCTKHRLDLCGARCEQNANAVWIYQK